MAEELKGRQIGDDCPEAEVDGAYFGGHIRPANKAEDRVVRRLAKHQTSKRKVVVVLRERGGETLPGVFKSESHALSWIESRVVKSTVLHADDAPAWNDLHSRFEVKRIDHQEAYSLDGVSTNMALLQPPAPWRDGAPSLHRWPLSPPVCAGSRLARRQPPRSERRAGATGRETGVGSEGVSGLLWQRHIIGTVSD